MSGHRDSVRGLATIAVAAMAAAIALAAAPAALAQADDAPVLEALVDCEPKDTLIAFAASPEPYRIALLATGAGDDEVSLSLQVLRVSHWPVRDGAGDDAQVALVDHGGGMATVTVDRSTAGERLVEVTASDVHGESRAVHLLRILPAPSEPSADRGSQANKDAHDYQPELEVLLGGVPVRRVDLAESPGVACLELRTPGAEGDAVDFTLNVIETAPLDPLAGAGAPPTLVDHGDGTAMVMVDKSAAGERTVQIGVSDAYGEELDWYILRVLSADADSRPQGHAGGLPYAVEGRSAAGAPLPPRLVTQAHQQMCADTPYTEDTWGVKNHDNVHVPLFDWSERPAMSGVPPIEGTSKMDAAIIYPDGSSPSTVGERYWWGCHTRASFGTQVPQWVILCDVPGDDRTHYYIRNAEASDNASAPWRTNPYTGNVADYNSGPAHTYAAAPGPHWLRVHSDDPAYTQSKLYGPFGPYAYVPYNELFVKPDYYARSIYTRVDGTYSSVPELLPFSDRMVIRATAFHEDNVTFHIRAKEGVLDVSGRESHALVNGTLVPLSVEWAGLTSFYTTISVSVRVSDIAKDNDIFIRGINDDERTRDGVVKELHEVALVASIPVSVPNKHTYAPIDPAFAITPWECWPSLDGTAWVP